MFTIKSKLTNENFTKVINMRPGLYNGESRHMKIITKSDHFILNRYSTKASVKETIKELNIKDIQSIVEVVFTPGTEAEIIYKVDNDEIRERLNKLAETGEGKNEN